MVSLRALVETTGSSEVTIRRDLRSLEQENLLNRSHGGAVLPGGLTHELSYLQKSSVAADEKVAIAVAAAGLVQEGDAILLGAGSTTQAFAQQLTGFRDLTVVTNSLLVAEKLAGSSVEVIVTGGTLRGSTFALVGAETERSLADLRLHRAFLSGNGLSVDHGLSTPNVQVASSDRAIVSAASEAVVLADHTKLGVDTMCRTLDTDRITHLVTDWRADRAVVAAFRERGVVVHVATKVTADADTGAGSTG
ncbi:DeoR/GlpR family DNA-binding transcription regulator [Allobranchiibius sp. GilTou73]|uniref:DeoR/GlpR family DNA-binding transcription regulator n=1 Tax=Allobranchiibius sp. GilTou73 TaxID=2904523 RepID=UPI001F47613F|nr:DeoR/GlpR family DNA-binding transcription regulator [Allobranchiibius sp. GilTou73]UIJ35804.1 DeoR/GlpR family DNA-binding transcription regulator [Allobranchiibius sp. GilTou73]